MLVPLPGYYSSIYYATQFYQERVEKSNVKGSNVYVCSTFILLICLICWIFIGCQDEFYDRLPKGIKSAFSTTIAKGRASGLTHEELPLSSEEKQMILDTVVQPEEGETAEETLRDFEEQEAISLPYFNPETLVRSSLSLQSLRPNPAIEG